jgi:hypothetical protein
MIGCGSFFIQRGQPMIGCGSFFIGRKGFLLFLSGIPAENGNTICRAC